MRKKVGTVLDEQLLERARRAAQAEGKTLAAFIQEALLAHLMRRESGRSTSVQDFRGAFKMSARDLEETVQAGLYDP